MRIRSIFAAVISAFLYSMVSAAPASPIPFTYVQPDGTVIRLQLHGDEYFHWTTLAGTRQVMVLGDDGWWRPTVFDDSSWRAGQERRQAANDRRLRLGVLTGARPGALRRTGVSAPSAPRELHIPVFLLEFPDRPFSAEATWSRFNAMFNQPGFSADGAFGSVRDYYAANSNGTFLPVFDVYGPVTLPYDCATFYGPGVLGKTEYALIHGAQLLDDQVDFSQYDADRDGVVDIVLYFFAGHGANESGYSSKTHMWPLESDLQIQSLGTEYTFDGKFLGLYGCAAELFGSGISGIGTACHEFAHSLGLPDLYPQGSADRTNGELYEFSLMCSGNYLKDGVVPPGLNAVERMILGWMREEDAPEIPDGAVSIGSISENTAYRYHTDNEGEFFLFECRDGSGWDTYLPKGMVVYHVDQSNTLLKTGYTASALWMDGNKSTPNNVVGHPCFYVVPAGHQSWDYYSEPDRTKFVFPGSLSVTSYSPVAWGDSPTGLDLSDIRFSDEDRKVHLLATRRQSATITLPEMGFNAIADPGNGQYAAGSTLLPRLELAAGSAPQSVTWTFDGNALTGSDPLTLTVSDPLTLPAGTHTLVAVLRYADGTAETLELTLEAK